ncbi:MAG: integrase arm-type DNA-binding domain-containing protein [Myxococcales bacterium]|jgi:integrase|nr:integrase arm-type DNA-binding domain-containing protein [Myxococcales bacterium]
MATRQRQVLTDAAIRNKKPKARPFNLTDGDGLFLYVQPGGAKYWRFAFYHLGKRKTLALGVYPDVSLTRARELTAEARAHVAAGRDPCALKKAAKAARVVEAQTTFEAVATAWMSEKSEKWTESHVKEQRRRLEKDLLPLIGTAPIAELKALDLVRALKVISERGLETAKRSRILLNGVFRYAAQSGIIEADPTPALAGAIDAPEVTHFPAPTDPSVVGGILRALDAADIAGPVLQSALRLHPLVVVRPGELERARWEDFDFEAKEWRFVPSKTQRRNKTPHVVPLSRQALAILDEVRPFSCRSEWVFPGQWDRTKPMSNAAMRSGLARIGIGPDVLVPHGWRSVFRTLGAERCGFQWDCLEAQLAHAVPDVLGRAYNRAEWMEQRRAMMQRWADYLDELKAGTVKGGMK